MVLKVDTNRHLLPAINLVVNFSTKNKTTHMYQKRNWLKQLKDQQFYSIFEVFDHGQLLKSKAWHIENVTQMEYIGIENTIGIV